MKIVLINPPFTDPMIPPPALAALAESLFPVAEVVAFDLSLEVFNALFDSSVGGTKESVDKPALNGVEGPSATFSFGKHFRAAFQNGIPALLKMKALEHKIQKTLNTTAGGLFSVGRGSLNPGGIWPPSLMKVTLDQFSSSVFGQAIESEVRKILPSMKDAECVGISMAISSQIIPALLIAQLLRREGYDGLIAFGGALQKYIHEYLASHSLVQEWIDLIFVGEFPSDSKGFMDYCAAWYPVRPKARSLCVLHSGQFEATGAEHIPPELISNGSGYTTLPLSEYWGAEPLIHITITRGCYWGQCAFCALRRVVGGSANECAYIRNSPEQAIRRMMSFQEKLDVSVLDLETDVLDPKTLVEIARGLARRKGRPSWHAVARFENELTHDVLEELSEGGCRMIFFGFETASSQMLQRMNKGTQLTTVKRILRDCAEVGIGVEISLFFGFPGEQEKDALLTLDFITEHSDLIHHCDAFPFMLSRFSPVGLAPEKYGIEIIEPTDSWDRLKWRDLNSPTLKDPQGYVERLRIIRPEWFMLEIPEDVWLVCKYGVRVVEEQLRRPFVK